MKKCFKLFPVLCITLASLLQACIQPKAPGFVPGELIVGIRPDISIQEVFDLAEENEVDVLAIHGFDYYSPMPEDSLGSVLEALRNMDYLLYPNALHGLSEIAWDNSLGKIYLVQGLKAMNLSSQEDWRNFLNRFSFEDAAGLDKWLLIQVPEGQEEAFIERLIQLPEVDQVERNGLVEG